MNYYYFTFNFFLLSVINNILKMCENGWTILILRTFQYCLFIKQMRLKISLISCIFFNLRYGSSLLLTYTPPSYVRLSFLTSKISHILYYSFLISTWHSSQGGIWHSGLNSGFVILVDSYTSRIIVFLQNTL